MMKSKILALFENKFILFLSILTVKVGIIFFLLTSYKNGNTNSEKIISGFVFKSNDYSYFLQPVDNYFETGQFTYGYGKPYAGRMPAYWIVYWGLRYVFTKDMALAVLVILQLIVSVLAALFIAKTAFLIVEKKIAYWLALILSAFCLYTISYDIQTQTESLAVSAIVFFAYHYISYYKKIGNVRMHLFLAGIFLAWAIFLRLYLGILLPIMCLFIVIGIYNEYKRFVFKRIVGYCLLFAFPFIFFDSLWIARNYNVYGKFIPLESALHESYGKLYPKSWTKIRSLIVTMGQDAAYFEPNTLGKWFKDENDSTKFKFQTGYFNDLNFNEDSLQILKNNFTSYYHVDDSANELIIENKILSSCDRFISDYKNKRKSKVYLSNPVLRFKKYIFASGSGYLILAPFKQMNIIEKIVKYATSFYYYFILIFSVLFVFIKRFWSDNKLIKHFTVLSLLAIVSNILVIVFVSDIQENRYLMPIFPFLIILTALFFTSLFSKRNSTYK